eukprot:2764825-Alexandrium_andersonii.AAC.1
MPRTVCRCAARGAALRGRRFGRAIARHAGIVRAGSLQRLCLSIGLAAAPSAHVSVAPCVHGHGILASRGLAVARALNISWARGGTVRRVAWPLQVLSASALAAGLLALPVPCLSALH